VRAGVVTELNGPDGVVIREVPDPTLRPGHVLIDVEYAGISFPDVLQTRANTKCVQNCRLHPAGRYPVSCAKIRVVSVLETA
jgi:NADPH:quinone reductase-like Zn-dependent oxidoreductase